jgi:hypothetical protein
MKTSSYFGLGSSLIAATVATVALSSAPAQAAVLNLQAGDTLNITGQADFSLVPFIAFDNIDFTTANVESDSTGGFFTNYVAGGATISAISDIDITQVGGSSSINYEGVATNPLIAFSDGVKFVANNPFDVVRQANGSNGVLLNFDPFWGSFTNASGAVLGDGLFSAQQFLGTDGAYSMTIKAKDVPEPLTTLGAGLALGFGGLFQRQRSGKGKNRQQS